MKTTKDGKGLLAEARRVDAEVRDAAMMAPAELERVTCDAEVLDVRKGRASSSARCR